MTSNDTTNYMYDKNVNMYNYTTDNMYNNTIDMYNITDNPNTSTDNMYNSSTDNLYNPSPVESLVRRQALLDKAVSGLISAHTAKLIETVVQAGLLPVLVLFGVTMNVMNMAVFSRQGFRDRINVSLFSLAVSDSGFLLSVFSSRVYSLVQLADSALGQYWKARSLVMVGVYTGFLNTSNLLTLFISLDRCLCVVSPLHARRLLSARHTAILVTLVFTVCLSCCGLACFKYDVITYVDPLRNVTSYRSTLTPFYRQNRAAIDAVYQYTFNVAVPTLSLLIVTVATAVIAVNMRKVTAWRMQMTQATSAQAPSSTDRREAAVTRMLVVMCVTFTLCTIPTVTLSFVRNLVPGFLPSGRYTHTFYASNSLMHLFSSLNCSVNFVIYYVMGSRFRATLRGLARSGSSRGGGGGGSSRESVHKTASSSGSLSTITTTGV